MASAIGKQPQTYEGRLFIGGELLHSSSGETFPVRSAVDPHGSPIARVALANVSDIDHAVAAAQAAQPQWAARPPPDRATILNKLAALMERDAARLGHLDSVCMGAPTPIAGFIGVHAANMARHAAALALHLLGHSTVNNPGMVAMTLHQPYGVVAAIIPWNGPVAMWSLKVCAAIAAGNAIVIKTSEKSPLSGIHLSLLAKEAGVPPGVINTVSGAGETGRLLAEHMQIRMIAMTGSVATGKRVAVAAAQSNLKKTLLELGGKSPLIVFEDADLATAIQTAAMGFTLNSGQVCIATSRIYVHESIAPAFQAGLAQALQTITLSPDDELTDGLGPLVDALQGEKVVKYLEQGKREAKAVTGGAKVEGRKGYFFEPTVFTGAKDDAVINKEEIFGPVAVLHTFKTEAEVISRANDTEYGLAAAVVTENVHRALRIAKAIEAGTVTVNGSVFNTASDLPFGGYKQSGNGRAMGPDYLKEWMETKTVTMFVKL